MVLKHEVNFKLQNHDETSYMYIVSAINDKPLEVPLEVRGLMNAHTSKFRQLEITTDLSNYFVLPGQRLGSAFSMHIQSCEPRGERQVYMNMLVLPILMTAWSTCLCL